MIVLDTNTVLRCVLQDDEEAANIVEDQMARHECLIFPEVVAEIVYVLFKVYRTDRKEIQQLVSAVLEHENAKVPYREVVEKALYYFAETRFDFIDCLMIGYATVEGHQIFTFDKKLKNRLERIIGG